MTIIPVLWISHWLLYRLLVDKAVAYRNSNMLSNPVEVIALEGEYFMYQPLYISG